ncbi:nitrate/nitrite transporter [Patulibacter sp.]|uniref:MFS transporter n=1 Tax=Patulibacter sp. TaxID=1912859 RepID=UPI002722DF94|nr:MFS transporter [Patulibacter sp.]MDO9409607.1 MFS transporter [Patulibacter sp.]
MQGPPATVQASSAPVAERPRLRRAWLVWGVGAVAYLVAMLHRMSLGVAGTDAAERFGVAVGALGAFTSLQLVLYLAMQVPAGLLADRFGPRRTLAIGLAIMAAGELLFAFAHSMPVGLAGRALVGIGDALTFLNVLRLAHAWFPQRLQPMLAALTGFAGALGQLASTVPLELGLRNLQWTGTFVLLGGVTALFAVVPLVLVRDRPEIPPDGRPDGPVVAVRHEPIGRTLAAAWRRPATRQGFFLHMGALSPFLIVAAVWGVPYMTGAQDLSRPEAASVLLVGALAFVVSGPLVALVVGPDPRRQRLAGLAFPAATTTTWAVLLLWPGAVVPHAVLLVAIAVTGVSAGGSMLAFEIARRASPPSASASAGALVNCGGFSAAVVGSLVIGRLLGDGDQGAVATQHAMLPVLAFAAIGLVGGLLTTDRGTRRPAPRTTAAPISGD